MFRQLMRLLWFVPMLLGTAQAASVTVDPPNPPPVFTSASISSDGTNLNFQLQFANGFDFKDHDAFGRQAESFQWYLTSGIGVLRPSNTYDVEYIIRGDGFGTNHTVELCTAQPFGAGCTGGWGVDIGGFAAAFDQAGLLAFEIPVAFFGTGALQYDVLGFRYGAENDGLNGFVNSGSANRWFPFPRDIAPPPPPNNGDPIGAPEPSSIALLLLAFCWFSLSRSRFGLSRWRRSWRDRSGERPISVVRRPIGNCKIG
jgi:hypothetical protein